MSNIGMGLSFPSREGEEPRWAPSDDEIQISDTYWLTLLTVLFTGAFPIPENEEFSLERATEVTRYMKENQAEKAKELMDFMREELVEMVKEAWEAVNGGE